MPFNRFHKWQQASFTKDSIKSASNSYKFDFKYLSEPLQSSVSGVNVGCRFPNVLRISYHTQCQGLIRADWHRYNVYNPVKFSIRDVSNDGFVIASGLTADKN